MLILDANVLIRSRGRLNDQRLVTVPEVVEELKSDRSITNFEVNEVDVLECNEDFYNKVKSVSSDINAETSKTDEKLVGLGLQTDGTVVSDDRELQNLCLHLGVEFEGFLDAAIEERREWDLVCSNCGGAFEGKSCGICGSREYKRKTSQ